MNHRRLFDITRSRTRLLLALSVMIVLCPATTSAQTPRLPPPKHGNVYVVAHRGAHIGIPENTLAAYRKAIELGVDFVEIDLRMTMDKRLVSIHNSTIDKYVVDGQTGLVGRMTLEELKRLDIGTRVGSEWKNERIPTFEEILELCRGKVGIYLDLKDAPVEAAVSLVQQWEMTPHVLWYADGRRLQRIKEICPTSIIMPDPGPAENLPRLIDRFHPTVIAAVWRHYTKSFVDTCHRASAIVIVDEQDKTSWVEALRWGTDGIQTDHPAELIAFLEAAKRQQTP